MDNLHDLLRLETIEQGLYRGNSQDLGFGAVFGGQVIGQALSAAKETLPPERLSFISQLLLAPGRCKNLSFMMSRLFATATVFPLVGLKRFNTAKQFFMTASFQQHEGL